MSIFEVLHGVVNSAIPKNISEYFGEKNDLSRINKHLLQSKTHHLIAPFNRCLRKSKEAVMGVRGYRFPKKMKDKVNNLIIDARKALGASAVASFIFKKSKDEKADEEDISDSRAECYSYLASLSIDMDVACFISVQLSAVGSTNLGSKRLPKAWFANRF